MTQQLDIQIVQGQRWTYLFEVDGLVEAGNGLRLHIRDHHGATLLRAGLTHDGATNARVSFTDGGILANLGATISTGWDLQGKPTRRWVYSVERYSLTDVDDVTVTHQGACIVIANPTDENSVDEVAPFPSFNLFALRFDIEQVLTEEQRNRVLAALDITPGGSPTVVHADTTLRDATDAHPMAAITGLVSALAGKETAGAVATHNADTGAHGQTATGRALVTAVSAAAARTAISLGNVDNTSDANKPISSATQTALDGKQSTAEKGSANGYASLDSGGKLPQAQLPAIAITEYLGSVANQTAMLALSGQKGDWCIRTDSGAVWIITGTDPTLLGSWTAVSYPASPVTSVAGRTGAVTISSGDVSGLGTAATLNVPASGNAASGEVVKGSDTRLDLAATIHAATDKPTPVDADEVGIWGSVANALRKVTWANIKATLKAYFDTLYATAAQGTDDRAASGVRETAGPTLLTVGAIADGQYLKRSGTNVVGDTPAGGSPGGSSGQGQYNNAGAFGGMPLWRVNDNTLLQRNGTTAQHFSVANTHDGVGTNYEVIALTFSSNVAILDMQRAGTGVARNFCLRMTGIDIMTVNTNGRTDFGHSQGVRIATTLDNSGGTFRRGANFEFTSTSTSLTLSTADCGAYYVLNSASDQNWTLPATTAANPIGFIAGSAKAGSYLRVTAGTGQTILLPTGKSSSGGYVRSTSADAVLVLVYSPARTMWIAEVVHGTWTIDS